MLQTNIRRDGVSVVSQTVLAFATQSCCDLSSLFDIVKYVPLANLLLLGPNRDTESILHLSAAEDKDCC